MTTVVLVIAADAFLIGAAIRHVLHEPAALELRVDRRAARASRSRRTCAASASPVGCSRSSPTPSSLGTTCSRSSRSFHVGGSFAAPLRPVRPRARSQGFQAIAFALFLYAAFEWVTTTAEEARTPRVITRALFIAPVLIWVVATLFASRSPTWCLSALARQRLSPAPARHAALGHGR